MPAGDLWLAKRYFKKPPIFALKIAGHLCGLKIYPMRQAGGTLASEMTRISQTASLLRQTQFRL